jgi:hypothetical protein
MTCGGRLDRPDERLAGAYRIAAERVNLDDPRHNDARVMRAQFDRRQH